MARLNRWIEVAAGALRDAHIRFALVGGLAIGVRAEPRFTRDVDFAVGVRDDYEAQYVVRCLMRVGFSMVAEFDHKTTGRIATVRMAPPGVVIDLENDRKPEVVDILFIASGIEPEVVASATSVPVRRDFEVPVAQIPHLIAMKLASVRDTRPLDAADLLALIKEATDDQLAKVPPLLQLIAARGFHRDKDLPGLFDHYLQLAGRRPEGTGPE